MVAKALSVENLRKHMGTDDAAHMEDGKKKPPSQAVQAYGEPTRLGAIVPSVFGLFVFYVAHDALQERVFRSPGFAFGWFMTACEIGTMFVCAALWEVDLKAMSYQKGPAARCLAALVVAIAVSQGTGSVALQFVNYPVKVAFKSCKLVPTMVFSQCLNASEYRTIEYVASVFMCLALALLALADAHAGPSDARPTQTLGFLLLAAAVCSDAIIPNLQERLLRHLKMPIATMIIYSNLGSFVLILAYIALTGELANALTYLSNHPDIAAILACQAICAYSGLRCYLKVIRSLSGVAGVLTTSARKVVTLVLSFVLFEKPFSAQHALSLLLLGVGVGLAVAAKHLR